MSTKVFARDRGRASVFVVAAALSLGTTASGQDHADLVHSVTDMLRTRYVLPERAERAALELERRLEEGAYEGIALGEIGPALQRDLREITEDKHFAVAYHPGMYRDLRANPPGAGETEQPAASPDPRAARANLGFTRVERLEGNVGLLRYDEFFSATHSGEKTRAAVELLADCDAVVIDLRANWGGDAAMVALLASYFFDAPEPVLLATAHDRLTGETTRVETDPGAPGRRIASAPVFCVVGANTRSAAEALAYFLRSQGRATTVGARTSGGAHAGYIFPLIENFVMFCPTSRREDAVTGGDWEGEGVPIDVECDEDGAATRAHLLAVEHAMTLGREEDQQSLRDLADALRDALDE